MASRVWHGTSCSNVHVLEAEVTGYEVTKKWLRNDVYDYVINVVWSYGAKTTTRRTYDEFFDLQCSILDKFPEEARPVTRVIPWLPGRKMLTPNSKKLADQRLPALDDYVKRVIQLPQKISRSDVLLTFFEPEMVEDKTSEKDQMLPEENIDEFHDRDIRDRHDKERMNPGFTEDSHETVDNLQDNIIPQNVNSKSELRI